jgi:hypothetical protein
MNLRFTQQLDHVSFWRCLNRGINILEPLAALTGIEDVIIRSNQRHDWFLQCLALRIRGERGELEEREWPTKDNKAPEAKVSASQGHSLHLEAWRLDVGLVRVCPV